MTGSEFVGRSLLNAYIVQANSLTVQRPPSPTIQPFVSFVPLW